MADNGEKNYGIFTETDKQLLHGKTGDWSSQRESTQRRRMRRRILNAIDDFELLFRRLSRKDRASILEEFNRIKESSIEERLARVIAFVYILLNEPNRKPELVWDQENGETAVQEDIISFVRTLGTGIKLGKEHFDHNPSGPVVPEVDGMKLYELPRKRYLRAVISSEKWRESNKAYREALMLSGDYDQDDFEGISYEQLAQEVLLSATKVAELEIEKLKKQDEIQDPDAY